MFLWNISSGGVNMNKSFISSLFDFSFTDFITPKIISTLYIIGVIFAIIGSLAFIVVGFTQGIGAGIVALLLSPIYFALMVIFIRVYMEIIIILFKINEGISRLSGPDNIVTSRTTPPPPPIS